MGGAMRIFTNEQEAELHGFVKEIMGALDKIEHFCWREDVITALSDAAAKTDSWNPCVDISATLKKVLVNNALEKSGEYRYEQKMSKVRCYHERR